MQHAAQGDAADVHLYRDIRLEALRDSPEAFGSSFEVESGKGFVRGDLARAVVESGWDLNELRPAAMSLEEIFLQLTGAEKAAQEQGAVKEAQ